MLLGESLQGARLEQPPPPRARPEHELLDDRPEGATEPPADGHRKAHLLPPEDRPRHDIVEGLPQHRLGLPATKLEAARHRGDMLHELVVEERYPALHGPRHAH